MSFALAIRNVESPARKVFYSTTSLIVMATVLFNGGLTSQMILWLRIRFGLTNDEDPVAASPTSEECRPVRGVQQRYNPWDKAFLPRKWYNFDAR